MAVIALLTDFGTQDIYVGVMKGVIWSICPDAKIADLTHEIPPQDVTAGALALWGAFKFFPKGTVFCAVVDPGVGTSRRAIAIQTREHFFVGPDNGLLCWAISESEVVSCVELLNRDYFLPTISRTFHGRDIFAPVSAHIARGIPLEEFGPELRIDELVKLPPLRAEINDQVIRAEVVIIDRFGNAITNLRAENFVKWEKELGQRGWVATIGDLTFNSLSSSYAEVPVGEPLLLFNSYGLLEVAVNRGNAAEQMRIRKGDILEIRVKGSDGG
ncbi:MAG: S-adenosyl-l-methionine hydroxide adenosyltransferase family protein [Armatimonadetes bacterium]|nr:S-adenosyl-l-methionine hydroxide adenosyltransferase family protein [Armatimonadota bacterium]MCX7968357.1 S-adenosyl-l-methionine hydroxide adenosyltransferase family protein [Armatimonadota bacterium]MDW8142836.1 SAM-dependent chlorinase/fluorinase [Armatimonadota bacterium]